MPPAPHEVPVERLLPHRPPMLLLERLLTWSASEWSSAIRLRGDGPYVELGHWHLRPIWCLELMAQAAAAGIAYGAAVSDQPRPASGFVIGVEDLQTDGFDSLPRSAELRVEAHLEVDVPPAAEIATRIVFGSREVARARLKMLVGGGQVPTPRPDALPFTLFNVSDGIVTVTPGTGHRWLEGHFPGMPVLPAVGQLRFVEHAAFLLTGRKLELVSIEKARFHAPAVPGDTLELSLDLAPLPRLGWTIRRSGQRVASGRGRVRG